MDAKHIRLGLMLLALSIGNIAFGQSKYDEELARGNDLYAEGEFEEAEAAYRNAMYEDGERFESRFNLGTALFRQERYAAAIDAFREASLRTTETEKQSKAWYNIGNAYLKLEDQKNALDAFKQSLLRDPKNENARFNLSKLMREYKEDEDTPSPSQNSQQNQDQQQQNQQEQQQNQQGQQQNQQGQDENQDGSNSDSSQGQQGQGGQNSSGDASQNQQQAPREQRPPQDGNTPSGDPSGSNPMQSQPEGSNARRRENQERQSDQTASASDLNRDEAAGDGEGQMNNSGDMEANPEGGEMLPGAFNSEEMTSSQIREVLRSIERMEEETLKQILRRRGRNNNENSEKDW